MCESIRSTVQRIMHLVTLAIHDVLLDLLALDTHVLGGLRTAFLGASFIRALLGLLSIAIDFRLYLSAASLLGLCLRFAQEETEGPLLLGLFLRQLEDALHLLDLLFVIPPAVGLRQVFFRMSIDALDDPKLARGEDIIYADISAPE